ncbi:membrane protein [Streptomyces zagrosensis]|uniref:Membrane protein n=1 Tax=Streptomyces zagrosensis TaxID=1042984 RepID=A0A7W9Q950_9ACTN|nr:membrane protein [Streptomyces zagrosensis]
MDWLTRLPWIGPVVARLMRTHVWRTYETLERVHWTRLAAAITFISFLALFPLITVGAAIGAAVLSDAKMRDVEGKLADQVPGISGQLDLSGLVDNAATVGVLAGAALLFTGIGWVGSLRECLRAVWELADEHDNVLLRKLKDGGILLGLGGVALGSFAVSAFAVTAVGWAAEKLDIPEGGAGSWLLRLAAFAAAVGADFLLLCYVLTWLPGLTPPRRAVVVAALIGAIGFELLKSLLSGYMQGVAAKSMYGAFGTPIALLLWINLTAKLSLFCAGWTATPSKAHEILAPDEESDEESDEEPDAAPEESPEAESGRAERAHGQRLPGEPGRGVATPAEATPAKALPVETADAPAGRQPGADVAGERHPAAHVSRADVSRADVPGGETRGTHVAGAAMYEADVCGKRRSAAGDVPRAHEPGARARDR